MTNITVRDHCLTLIRMTKDEKGLACCFFQRLIALKCLKCQKNSKKYLFLVLEVFFLVNPISPSKNKLFSMILTI
jgi:hypothetical protein